MTSNAGEKMNINVGKNMFTSVGNNQDLKVTKDITVSASNHNEEISQNKILKVFDKIEESTGSTKHTAKNGDILIHSSGLTTIFGSINTRVNKG